MSDLDTFGFMFEALVERDLRIYAQTFNAELFHYQDYSNNENNLENGKKAIELYKNYISSLVCTKSAAFQTRELGYTIYIGALVYDWCYDELTTAQKEEIVKILSVKT